MGELQGLKALGPNDFFAMREDGGSVGEGIMLMQKNMQKKVKNP
jgi:hypothetical protein